MKADRVSIFKPFPFEVGQKIHIQGGHRNGDWEVIGVTEHKVKLRCPVSQKEVSWERFCYFLEEKEGAAWPERD